MHRWVRLVLAGALTIAAASALWYLWLGPKLRTASFRARIAPRLESRDPQTRADAVYEFVDRTDPFLFSRAALILGGDDAEPAVREAAAYVIGRRGDEAFFPAIQQALELESDGAVRAAAWLAAARISPARFRALLDSLPARPERWDAIGRADGLLSLGDTRGVKDVLLPGALEGGEGERFACTQSLYKGLRPLLEVAGRWPISPLIVEGDTWPREFVREVAARCAPLDLDQIHADSVPCFVPVQQLQQTLRRLTRGRDRISHWLFSTPTDKIEP